MYAEASAQERKLDEELASWLEWPIEMALGVAAFIVYWLLMPHGLQGFNDQIKQAYALLHGTFYADSWPPHEAAFWHGHLYVVHPPLAALLVLPFTAIGGQYTNQAAISVILCSIEVVLMYRMVRCYGATCNQAVWLTIAFAFGSMFTWEAAQGTTWGLCLTLSTIPTTQALVALKEEKSRRVGFWAGLAFLARYDLSMAWIPYALSLLASDWSHWRRSIGDSRFNPDFGAIVRRCAGICGQFALGIVPSICTYAAWSWAKYGSLHDRGIELWFAQDTFHGVIRHDGFPFWIGHLPYTLYTWFFMAPAFVGHWPYIVPTDLGVSIALSTPFLFLAFKAPWSKTTGLLWLAVVLSMLPASVCYASGFVQFEDRYWIMALPFLMALIALGVHAQYSVPFLRIAPRAAG